MSNWTPELREQAIELYKELNPTGANTSECVKAVAEELGLYRDWETDRKSTRLNSSHSAKSRMPSSA